MEILSEKLSNIAKKASEGPVAPVPDGISVSMADVSQRLTALEEAVREIQAKLAPPTTTKAGLDYANIMPAASVGGGKRRKTRKNRKAKKRC